jgi:hypothetical protein
VAILIYYVVEHSYKSFIWYASGKKGFSGLFTLGVFFLVRSLVFFINPDLLILLNKYDIFISGLISFTSFLNIFILAKG